MNRSRLLRRPAATRMRVAQPATQIGAAITAPTAWAVRAITSAETSKYMAVVTVR